MAKSAELVIDIVAHAEQAIGQFKALRESSGSHMTALKVAGVAAAGSVIAALASTTHAAMEHETAVAKLTTVYKDAGLSTKDVNAGLEEVEKSTRRTGQSTEDSITAYTKLVLATHNTTKAHEELAVAQDLAALKGIPVEAATNAVIKANNGNTKALKAMGIATTDTAGNALSTTAVMANLTKAVHGQADAYGDTAAGGMARFHESLDQTKEKIGTAVLPAMQGLIKILMPLFDWLGKNQKILGTLVPILGIAAVLIIGVAKAVKLWRDMQLLLNSSLFENPLGLIVLAIIAVIVIVIECYKHFRIFRDAINDVWAFIKRLGDWIQSNWKIIIDILLGPLGVIITNFQTVKSIVEDVINALKRVGDAVSGALKWLGKIPGGGIVKSLSHLNPFAASASSGAPTSSVVIQINATPGSDLPEVVYDALRAYQRRHVRPELVPLFR